MCATACNIQDTTKILVTLPTEGTDSGEPAALVTVPCKAERPFPSSTLGSKDWQLACSL